MLRIPPDHRLDAAPRPGALVLLAETARRQTDGTLALCAGTGLVVAAVAFAFVPLWTPIALSALAVAAFGGWGIVDRTAAERGERSDGPDAALRAVRALLATVGVLAFLGFALAMLAGLVGRVIS